MRLLILLCETICNSSFGFCCIREWKLLVFSVTSVSLWTQSNREQTLRQNVWQWSSHSQKWTWLVCNHTVEGFVLFACKTVETHCFAKLSLLHSVQCRSSQKFYVYVYVRLAAQHTVRCLHQAVVAHIVHFILVCISKGASASKMYDLYKVTLMWRQQF